MVQKWAVASGGTCSYHYTKEDCQGLGIIEENYNMKDTA